MSKYSEFSKQIVNLLSKGLNSEEIAGVIIKDNPNISRSGLSRYVRRVRELATTSSHGVSKHKEDFGILIFDIETAPMKAWSFQKWGTNIADDFIIQDWFIISWSAKWLFSDEVVSMVVTPEEALQADDNRVVMGLWDMFNEASILVAHNLHKFDKKKANARFLKHGLTPPSPYQCIDTLQHFRSNFAITSNRLDYIAKEVFGIEGKFHTGKELWLKAISGDGQALKDMDEYCRQDVRVLEECYLRLRPWIKSHPNVGLYIDDETTVCPSCGSYDLRFNGEYVTMASVFDNLTCNDCGAHSRSRKNKLSKKHKDNLIVSNAR